MGSAADAGERLLRLARNERYHGPQSDTEAEMVRNWVLNGENTLERSEQTSATATRTGG